MPATTRPSASVAAIGASASESGPNNGAKCGSSRIAQTRSAKLLALAGVGDAGRMLEPAQRGRRPLLAAPRRAAARTSAWISVPRRAAARCSGLGGGAASRSSAERRRRQRPRRAAFGRRRAARPVGHRRGSSIAPARRPGLGRSGDRAAIAQRRRPRRHPSSGCGAERQQRPLDPRVPAVLGQSRLPGSTPGDDQPLDRAGQRRHRAGANAPRGRAPPRPP